jgi:hypothetical protein
MKTVVYISENVNLLVGNLHAEAIETVKSRAALSASTQFNFDFRWYWFRAEASKPIPICEFLNRFRKSRNFVMIQNVEYYR